MAERGYHDLIMAGAAAQDAKRLLTPADFQRAYARAHMAGLQAAWRVFTEALAPKRDNVRRFDGHHPSKLG